MAERRMFAKTIIDSDSFLDMPATTQLLYFHLSMRADDEGFINNPKSIMRNVGCKDDDMKMLIAKNFIIPFETGIVVIRHWKIHNYIQKDRFKPTQCQEEKEQLELENNVYTKCIQPGYNLDTQVRIGKERLVKDSIEIEKKETLKSVLDGYSSNPDLISTLQDYIEMRKTQKGFTVKALKLNLNELDKLAVNDEMKIDIVNQTIANGWKGFYPLKSQKVQQKQEERAF